MCELKSILVDSSTRETLMENTIRLKIEGDKIELTGILGEKKMIRGKITDINITKQEAIIVK
ncbi:RNA-binding protein [Methanosarcinales archaeon ex4484_138]|nr:MAG: RNA-binding protein [Methanosarcinales archaeon ex4484_138]RLG25987.1 MAG: RNA-binding protein [Methanosarcinales archaeon]RLG27229.1 MAG: RNA-binding protein [Methanosarcinales archaeon]